MKSKNLSFSPLMRLIFFSILLSVSLANHLFAQQINPKILDFDKICAGGPHPTLPNQVFNEYQAAFNCTGFAADVTFKVELSDPTGSFTTPTATTPLAALPGTPPDTATDKTLTFAVPTNLVGSNTYRLRVVSSTGIVSQAFTVKGSTSNKNVPAYYKAYSNPFAINNNQPTASFCFGGSLVLTVYNPTPAIPNSSPANYAQLKYIWYKDGSVISGQTTSSLSVTTAGKYYAKLDYGDCSDDNFRSQEVTVTGATGAGAVIVSSSGNPFCASFGATTLSITAGNSYQWKKDGVILAGINTASYTTDVPGVYSCDVDFGGCKSTGSIDLKVFENTTTISGVTVNEENFIVEGETLTATITSDAISPTYQWFLNTVLLPSETSNSIQISTEGSYKAIVTQTSGCAITSEFPFDVSFKVNLNVPKISNIVSPNGDGVNDTWIIPDQYLNGTNTKIMILNALGEIVYETTDYDNYSGWPQEAIEFKNFNPVYYYIITPNSGSAKKGSITLVK